MVATKHLHDRHRGNVPESQLATGTPTAGYLPVATGTGTAAWTALGGGGGGGQFTEAAPYFRLTSTFYRIGQEDLSDGTDSYAEFYGAYVTIAGNGLTGYAELDLDGTGDGDAMLFAANQITLSVDGVLDSSRIILMGGTGVVLVSRTSDPSGAQLAEGLVWYNRTDHMLRCYDGTVIRDCW